jgi:hypothetical protein
MHGGTQDNLQIGGQYEEFEFFHSCFGQCLSQNKEVVDRIWVEVPVESVREGTNQLQNRRMIWGFDLQG